MWSKQHSKEHSSLRICILTWNGCDQVSLAVFTNRNFVTLVRDNSEKHKMQETTLVVSGAHKLTLWPLPLWVTSHLNIFEEDQQHSDKDRFSWHLSATTGWFGISLLDRSCHSFYAWQARSFCSFFTKMSCGYIIICQHQSQPIIFACNTENCCIDPLSRLSAEISSSHLHS